MSQDLPSAATRRRMNPRGNSGNQEVRNPGNGLAGNGVRCAVHVNFSVKGREILQLPELHTQSQQFGFRPPTRTMTGNPQESNRPVSPRELPESRSRLRE